jgi:LysR family hydrogen peroxide-inducible transcriptional activator
MAISPPHPFSLRQLQYVVALADTLSFRRAAEQCHVAQPSLSSQLAALEGTLGVRLFERGAGPVLATPAGAAVIDRARRLLVEADDLVAAARRLGDPLTGMLRLGVIPTISPYLLPQVSPKLRAGFPELTLRWVEDKTEVLVAQLAAGTLDAAVLALEAEIGDLDRDVLFRDPFVLAVPCEHPLARERGPVRADALEHQPVLLLEEGHCFRTQALAFCGHARADELEFRATSLPTLVQMVAGGAGVTLLPELALATEGDRAALRIRRFAGVAPYRTIALVWRRRSPLGDAFRALAGALRTAAPTADGGEADGARLTDDRRAAAPGTRSRSRAPRAATRRRPPRRR